MYKHTDQYYGADADGNRGMPLDSYIIEPSDTGEIIEQIHEFMEDYYELPSNPLTISLIEPGSEELVELDINPFDYLDRKFCIAYLNSLKED